MDKKLRAEYIQRLVEENQAMLDSMKALDPDSESYAEDVSALTEWHKVVATDYKNFGDLVEGESRLKHDKKASKISSILQGLGIAVTVGTFAVGEKLKHDHFKAANEFQESGGFYGKQTDKIAVNEALRTERPFWQFWKK